MFISEHRQVTLFKRFAFKIAAIIVVAIFANCNNPVSDERGKFTFSIADVGQGLAQFGIVDGRAVVWDVGPPSQYSAWRAAYNNLGRPRIEAIVISHSDNDHYGGLAHLDANINWDGNIIISPHEDTAKVRAASAQYWQSRITFSFAVRGDTLNFFDNVEIICLWPPAIIADEVIPLNSVMRNRYSHVFSVRHGNATALITSDIDSVSMGELALVSRHDLRAQILSVPHHGSGGSVNALFFSYVSADIAVISCGRQNQYGHPATSMLDALIYQGLRIYYTHLDQTKTFTSNGFYWQQR